MAINKGFFAAGLICGALLALWGIWTILFPPVMDEPQGYSLIAIGLGVVLVGYVLAQKRAKDASP
jgi:hypothetical protein